MNTNILVPCLERAQYIRDQKPLTGTLAPKPSTHHNHPALLFQRRVRPISASMEEPFGTLHIPSLGPGPMCCPWTRAWRGWLTKPPPVPEPVVPLPQGSSMPPTSTTRSCHLRSTTPALGISTVLLVTSRRPDTFW